MSVGKDKPKRRAIAWTVGLVVVWRDDPERAALIQARIDALPRMVWTPGDLAEIEALVRRVRDGKTAADIVVENFRFDMRAIEQWFAHDDGPNAYGRGVVARLNRWNQARAEALRRLGIPVPKGDAR